MKNKRILVLFLSCLIMVFSSFSVSCLAASIEEERTTEGVYTLFFNDVDYNVNTFKFVDLDNSLTENVRFAMLYNLILAYFIWDVAKFIVIRVFNIMKKWGYKNVRGR